MHYCLCENGEYTKYTKKQRAKYNDNLPKYCFQIYKWWQSSVNNYFLSFRQLSHFPNNSFFSSCIVLKIPTSLKQRNRTLFPFHSPLRLDPFLYNRTFLRGQLFIWTLFCYIQFLGPEDTRLRTPLQYIHKPHANGRNFVGQQLPTLLAVTCCIRLHGFLLFRDRRSVAQQCWIRLRSSSNIVGATNAH